MNDTTTDKAMEIGELKREMKGENMNQETYWKDGKGFQTRPVIRQEDLEPELKPCPFCGSTAVYLSDLSGELIEWRIKCDRCGSRTQRSKEIFYCVSTWNTRALNESRSDEWRYVEDGLPAESKHYNLTIQFKDKCKPPHVVDGYFDTIRQVFGFADSNYFDVIAYRPLPQPAKEKE